MIIAYFLRRLSFFIVYLMTLCVGCGYAVTQLVEALRYKPEGRGFNSQWCHWNFD
jgi:hypothetical protein